MKNQFQEIGITMKNLKNETLEAMRENSKTIEDIAWVGSDDFSIPVDLFFKLADTEYDNGYGSAEVAMDLKIVFTDNTMLYRWEYDGSEGWEFISLIKPSIERNDINALTINQASNRVHWGYDLAVFNGA